MKKSEPTLKISIYIFPQVSTNLFHMDDYKIITLLKAEQALNWGNDV